MDGYSLKIWCHFASPVSEKLGLLFHHPLPKICVRKMCWLIQLVQQPRAKSISTIVSWAKLETTTQTFHLPSPKFYSGGGEKIGKSTKWSITQPRCVRFRSSLVHDLITWHSIYNKHFMLRSRGQRLRSQRDVPPATTSEIVNNFDADCSISVTLVQS